MLRNVVFAILTLSYPLAIWLLGDRVQPKWLALSLVLLGALRLAATKQRGYILLALGAFALAAVTGFFNAAWPLHWYPVFVNASLLVLFGVTLRSGMPMVERLARLREKDLPPHAVAYTRKVTVAWCVFFVVNGLVAAGTCLWASEKVWALYNGAIAYVLMGVFGGIELLVRRSVKKKHELASPPLPLAGEGRGEGRA